MNRRTDRINGLLRREISRILATELRDPRMSAIVSVTHVEATSDLRYAKVHISVLGDEDDKKGTLRALRSASGFIHWNLRKHLAFKAIPSLEFILDESIEQGAKMLELIDSLAPEEESSDEA